VLWLNTSLTVRAGEAASHSKIGWQNFTQAVIKAAVSRRPRGIVFLLWGSHAQKAVGGIPKVRNPSLDTFILNAPQGKNMYLKSVHPSPLSVHRGFFGCNHFTKANEWLAETYGPEEQIDWTVICPK
jgi:uracil-DNA glycosylase